MKKTKRLLCLFMSLIIMLATVPFEALADTVPNVDTSAVNKWCEWQYTASTGTLYINTDGVLTSALNQAYEDFKAEIENGERPSTDKFTNSEHYLCYIPLYLSDSADSYWGGINYIQHIVFGKDITKIENGRYAEFVSPFENLRSISFEEGSKCKELGTYAFNSALAHTINLPDGLEIIGESAVSDTLVESMTVPDSVYHIGAGAFEGTDFEYFKLPDYQGENEAVIEASAFQACSFEEFEWGSGFTEIANQAFYASTFFNGATADDLVIPEGITKIGEKAFYKVNNVSGVVLPQSIEEIGLNAFSYGNINSVTFKATGGAVSVGNYAFYNSKINKIVFPADRSTSITLGDYSFGYNNMKNVTFTASVRTVGDYAFSDCFQLSTLKFNTLQGENGAVGTTSVGKYFVKGSPVSSVTLPSTLKSIGKYMFAESEVGPVLDLTSSGIETIEAAAFQDCSNLQEIRLPDTVTKIENNAFSRSGLVSFTAPSIDSDSLYGSGIFSGCAHLETVDLSALNYEIKEYDDETGEEDSYYLGYHIPDNTFSYDTNLKNVIYNPVLDNYKNEPSVDYASGHIGESAFEYCTSLTSDFHIPDNVFSIGESAFYGSNLSYFHFPSELRSIYKSAFGESSLRIADLSACTKLKTIGKDAFERNERLKTVKLPNSLETIMGYAFAESPVENLSMPSVVEIDSYAFEECKIKQLVIPNNCQRIYSDAFYNNADLNSVTLPQSITYLEASAFRGAENIKTVKDYGNLSSANLKSSFNSLGENVTVYGYENSGAQAFAQEKGYTFVQLSGTPAEPTEEELSGRGTCSGGTWEINSGNSEITLSINASGAIGNNVFTDGNGNSYSLPELIVNNGVNSVVFSDDVTEIPDNYLYSENNGLPTLHSITLPEFLEKIGNSSFRGLTGVTSIEVPAFVNDIGEYAFAESENLNVNINKCSLLKEIKEGAFYKTSTADVTVPINVKKLSKKAFGAYQGSRNSSIVIPSSCTNIYYNAENPAASALGFTENGTLDSSITVSTPYQTAAYDLAGELGINRNFGGENINGYYVNENKESYSWYYDAELNRVFINGETVISGKMYYFNGEEVLNNQITAKSVVINEGVKGIYGSGTSSTLAVFNPEYIYLPNTLTTIYSGALRNCTSLKAFEIPDTVTRIESYPSPFAGCNSLSSVVIGNGITKLPDNLFKGLKSLCFVEIGNNITEIGVSAFQNCVMLQEIIIPDSVKTIKQNAFYGCTTVEKLVIGSGLTSLGSNAMSNLALCNDVEVKCDINTVISSLGVGSGTTGVTLRLTKTAGEYMNLNCSQLKFAGKVKKIYLGECVYKVYYSHYLVNDAVWEVDEANENYSSYNGCLYSKDGKTLYRHPAQKTAVDIKDGTKTIGEYAFYNTNIKIIDIPEGIETIADHAFAECKGIKKVYLPDSLQAIGRYAFCECDNLKTITLPGSLNFIDEGAFYNCDNLASVIFNEGLQLICDEAFSFCKALKCVVIPQSVTNIGKEAFAFCRELEDAYIWESEIGENAFFQTNVTIHTLASPEAGVTNAYVYANAYRFNLEAYTDEDAFYDACEMARDINLGYLGFCTDGHGDIQWLTVYEADCEHDGYIIGVCEYCSEILEERHIDACGHEYVETLHVPSTATTRGVNVYTCTNCGEKYCEYTDIDNNNQQYTTQTLSGRIMIADSKEIESGKNPAQGASIMIDGTVIAKTDSDGYFSVALETGLYELVIHYSFGFDRTVFARVEDENLNAGTVFIIGCDFNRDGKIDKLDDNLFKMSMSSMPDDPSYLSYVDMNNDGFINIKDYAILKDCMGITNSGSIYEDLIIEK